MDGDNPPLNPDLFLRDCTFRDFSSWLTRQVDDAVEKKVAKETEKDAVDLANAMKSITSAHQQIANLKVEVQDFKRRLDVIDGNAENTSGGSCKNVPLPLNPETAELSSTSPDSDGETISINFFQRMSVTDPVEGMIDGDLNPGYAVDPIEDILSSSNESFSTTDSKLSSFSTSVAAPALPTDTTCDISSEAFSSSVPVPVKSMASTSLDDKTITSSSHGTVSSFGPAGSQYNVRVAGSNILDRFCHGFPNDDVSCIIPSLFGDNITELMEPREDLTRKQEDQFRGREINQEGERHELVVFNIFNRLIRQVDILPPLLVLRTFEMDTKNRLDLKRNALISILPNIKLTKINTEAENDFVVLVKNLGVVFVEVKGSRKYTMVKSAEKQLHNVNAIVQCIMKAITKDKMRVIPTMKLIMIPDCMEETPSEPTDQGSFFVYNDLCADFTKTWQDLVDKLHHIKEINPFSAEEFKELSEILVGIWSAKSVGVMQNGSQTQELRQDETKLSFVKQLKSIDEIVDTSNVRNEDQFKLQEDKFNPWTKISRTNESDIFRSSNSLKLCYLTPDQKQLFSHQKQAIVRSPAGCGKSLLILFKVLELVKDQESDSKILIVAPAPHDLRLRNALQSNNVQVEMIDQFPPPPSSSKVFIMALDDFFDVKLRKLMRYDLSNYHLLIDDLQNFVAKDELFLKPSKNVRFFSEVGDFIDQTYKTCVQFGTYLWVMLDVMQQVPKADSPPDHFPRHLWERLNRPRDYNISIVKLSHVMRNTENIIMLTNETRESMHWFWQASYTSPPLPQVGHKVTGDNPVCHELQKGTDEEHMVPFIISRLREELTALTKPPFSLPLSDVAVI